MNNNVVPLRRRAEAWGDSGIVASRIAVQEISAAMVTATLADGTRVELKVQIRDDGKAALEVSFQRPEGMKSICVARIGNVNDPGMLLAVIKTWGELGLDPAVL